MEEGYACLRLPFPVLLFGKYIFIIQTYLKLPNVGESSILDLSYQKWWNPPLPS